MRCSWDKSRDSVCDIVFARRTALEYARKASTDHDGAQGKTGVIYNVSKSAVGIIVFKKVKHRYIEKRLNIRIEHISPSRSRDDFLRRVKENARLRKEAQAEGKTVLLKRLPTGPREAHTISLKENVPETIAPLAYETTI